MVGGLDEKVCFKYIKALQGIITKHVIGNKKLHHICIHYYDYNNKLENKFAHIL